MTWHADIDLQSRTIESERARRKRWQTGYVTEFERRTVKTIREREAAGGPVTSAQLAFADGVEAALARRESIISSKEN